MSGSVAQGWPDDPIAPGFAGPAPAAAPQAAPGDWPDDPVVHLPDYGQGPNALGYQGPGRAGGLAPNFAAGAIGTVDSMVGAGANAVAGIGNLGKRALNWGLGTDYREDPTDYRAYLADAQRNQTSGLGSLTGGLDPNQVPANGLADRMARGAGGAVATLPLMAMSGGVVGMAPGLAGRLGAGVAEGIMSSPVTSLAGAALGGAGSVAGGELGKATGLPGAETAGSLIGGVGAGALPGMAGAAARGTLGWLAGGMDQEAARLAQRADEMGIPLGVGNLSADGSIKRLNTITKTIPFSGTKSFDDATQAAVNRNINQAMGVTPQIAQQSGLNIDKVMPETVQAAKRAAGDTMEAIQNATNIHVGVPDPDTGNTLVDDLVGISANANRYLQPTEARVVQNHIIDVLRSVNGQGQIEGQTFGNLLAKGSPLDKAVNNPSSNIAGYAQDIKDAVQGGWERALAGTDDGARYTAARTAYKAAKTIEPLLMGATTGTASPALGNINPVNLLSAVAKNYKNAATAPVGQIPLKDLALIGQQFLKGANSSGTAENNMWLKVIHSPAATISAAVGGEGALAYLAPWAAAPGALTLGVNRGVASMLRNPQMAQEMIQRGLGNPTTEFAGQLGQAVERALPSGAAGVAGANMNTPPVMPQGANGPTINPYTGQPQFDLQDALTASYLGGGGNYGGAGGYGGGATGGHARAHVPGLAQAEAGAHRAGQGGAAGAYPQPFGGNQMVPGPLGSGGPYQGQDASLQAMQQTLAPHGYGAPQNAVPIAGMQPMSPTGAVNPQTGLPSYSLKANQQAAEGDAEPLAESLRRIMTSSARTNGNSEHLDRRRLARGMVQAGEKYREWVAENRNAIRKAASGKAIERMHQIGAALQRRGNDGSGTTQVHHIAAILGVGGGEARHALARVGINDIDDAIAHGMTNPEITNLLIRNRAGGSSVPIAKALGKLVEQSAA